MYHVIELGTVSPDQHSLSWAINDAGYVTGASFHITPGVLLPDYIHAWVWKPTGNRFFFGAGVIEDLVGFGSSPSFAEGINNARPIQIVGRSSPLGQPQHAFRWTEGVGIVDIGKTGSEAWGINNLGIAVGTIYLDPNDHAAMWDAAGTFTDLAEAHGIPGYSHCYDINDASQIVGIASSGFTQPGNAFVIENGALTQLTAFGGQYSYAQAINQRGDIVGSAWSGTGTGRPALWPGGDRQKPIGLSVPGANGATTADINDRGDVVGAYTADTGESHALLWQDGIAIDLNDQVPKSTPWKITEAKGINNNGLITCTGERPGYERALLLVPAVSNPLVRIARVLEILFGIIAGGGGVVILPGGIPRPDPPPLPFEGSPEERDVLLALAAKELAALVHDPEVRTRREIEAVKDLIGAAERMLRDLERRR